MIKQNVSYKVGESGTPVIITDAVYKKQLMSWSTAVSYDYGKFFIGAAMENSIGNINTPFMIPNSGTRFNLDGGRRIFQIFVGVKLFAEDESF